jgi:hypothetical protein
MAADVYLNIEGIKGESRDAGHKDWMECRYVVEKAKAAGKYRGRAEDTGRNTLIQKHLKAGISSWTKIMTLAGCSRGTIAKQAARNQPRSHPTCAKEMLLLGAIL